MCGDFRDIAIGSDAQTRIADKTGRHKSGNACLWPEMNEFHFIRSHEVKPEIDIEPDPQFFTLELGDGLLEQLTIQIETD